MLPGKDFTLDDLLQLLRRRLWVFLLSLAAVSSATALTVRMLPNRYRSETVILVVPQRVPESYVKSTVTAKIEDRLQSIAQQILSRTRIERIIQDFDLYPVERRTRTLESVVAKMRADVAVQVVKGDAFKVAYVGDNAQTVMRVTDRLASLFIEENLRDREVLAEGTNLFLESQLEDARRRLVEHERKLEEYRKRFAGELPSQLTSNLAAIQNNQLQAQALTESINRDRDRRFLLERQIRDGERELAALTATALGDVPDREHAASGGTVAQQLAAARTAVAAMEGDLTAEHPDLQRMRRRVRELEGHAQSESSPESGVAVVPAPALPLDLLRRDRLSDLRAEMEQVDRQLVSKEDEHRRLRAAADSYQQRVERLPTRESELAELTRDYSTLQTMYATLLGKQEESKIAANLERRQIGEQFKLLDPARMAEAPFSPRRSRIVMAGVGAGLAIGLALAVLIEYRDRTFRTENELVQEFALPVLAVVPLMESEAGQRRAGARRLAIGCGVGTLVLGSLSLVVHTLLR